MPWLETLATWARTNERVSFREDGGSNLNDPAPNLAKGYEEVANIYLTK